MSLTELSLEILRLTGVWVPPGSWLYLAGAASLLGVLVATRRGQ